MKHNMHSRSDASCSKVVDATPRGVRRVADHDAPKYFLPKLATALVGHLRKDSAPNTELGRVGLLRRE
jgi:hypothetical protein